MSISNLFSENDYSLKLKNLEVSDNITHDGNVVIDNNFVINQELIDNTGTAGSNFQVLTSTGSQIRWRDNISGLILSSGSTTLQTNRYVGQGYLDINNDNASYVVSQPLTVRSFAVRSVSAPGVDNTFDFQLFKNGAPTGLIASITGSSTTAQSPIGNITFSQFDLISVNVILTGLPGLTTGSVAIDYIYNF
jgi:hypothetical protein